MRKKLNPANPEDLSILQDIYMEETGRTDRPIFFKFATNKEETLVAVKKEEAEEFLLFCQIVTGGKVSFG